MAFEKGSRLVRFERRVTKGPGCWGWTGGLCGSGYGATRSVSGKNMTTAHRVAYELYIGPIPDGLQVCHHCDNKLCVNPAHLFLGTQLDNMHDMIRKGRQAKDYNHPPQRGERNHGAKLSNDTVNEMRQLYATGLYTQASLARRFGTTRANAHCVLRRKSRQNG